MDILFIPLAKVDQERREVWGWAAEERPDKAGEVMDYETSKPMFVAWSETMSKNSGGANLGNVRAMHGPTAAGRLIHFEPRDDVKKFWVGAHIVDEAEWAKVQAGVYTGFSVGGSYAKKWTDPSNAALKRYTAAPAELSLVDNPCMHGATFEMVKADGTIEQATFPGEPPPAAVGTGVDTPADSPYLASLADTLAKYVDQQSEVVPPEVGKAMVLPLSKAGARHSAGDTKAIQAIHDSACALGGSCEKPDKGGAADADEDDDVKKLAKMLPPWMAADRAAGEITNIAEALAYVATLAARLLEVDPTTSQKISAAAVILGDTFNDLTAKLATAATEQQAAAAAQDAKDAAVAEAIAGAVDGAVMAMMAKLEAPESALQKAFSAESTANSEALAKLAPMATRLDDMAAQLGALETTTLDIQKRVASSGPVVRGIPPDQSAGTSDVDALQKMLATQTDPATRQALQQALSGMQIRQIHAGGGVRIG